MDGPARRVGVSVRADILGSGGLEHFGGGVGHILEHGEFVFTVSHMEAEYGNAKRIDHVRIDFNIIIPACQALAEASQADACNRVLDGPLVCLAETRRAPIEARSAATLVAVPAQKVLRARPIMRVPEANHVNAVRAV